jgi:hypothetical protein
MHVLTDSEIISSLEAMELRCEDRRVSFAGSEIRRVRIPLRVQEPHQLVYLARFVAHLSYDELHFRSARLWISAWSIWDPLTEAIALKAFEQFRRSYGENRSLESASGIYFRHDEFIESVCCLLQPILVGWDAYYVPTWAWGTLDYFVFISHDGFIDIMVRTQEMHDRAMNVLKKHNWLVPLLQT